VDNFSSYATAAGLLSIVRACLHENPMGAQTYALPLFDFNPMTLKLIIQIKSHCTSNF